MKKRGQFYLITAILIIAIILGLAAVLNYTKKNELIKIYDVKDDLKIESWNVLDYGVVTGDRRIEEFTQNYSEYVGEDINIHFISGSDYIQIYNYTNGLKNLVNNFSNPLDFKEVAINNANYTFEFKKGENFYFVISQKIGDEEYIVSG